MFIQLLMIIQNSDISATETESGRILTNAIHTLVQKWYRFLLPTSIIRNSA